jgi:scyllo-inositol 2-dehydrogenase (NADP+)
MTKRINTAVVGFGLSGRVFHAPFAETHTGFNLHSIMTSGDEAQKIYPHVLIVKTFEDILENPDIELVAICTPHHLHKEQAIKALHAGKHVIIEKPVAMSSLEIEEIMSAASQAGRKVFPYHNRRWDGDFLTLRHLISKGYLGEVMDFESHFDRYSPTLSRAEWRYNNEQGGGTLFDLGPHLIDQAVCLFGKPESVWCLLHQQREGSMVSDSFDLKLIYPKITATLRAGVFVREQGPRFQVHGSHGSYIKYGLDTQEARLKSGKMPVGADFGAEPRKLHGLLHSVANDKTIRLKYATIPGNYMGFYDDVAAVLAGKKEEEVSIEAAHLNLKIIEAALMSYRDKTNVEL